MMLWAAKDTGRVEAVVGPYKLYDHSFRTLQGNEWLSDEVIDAYVHYILEKQQFAEHLLSEGDISRVQTTSDFVTNARLEIACSLLEYQGKALDYCVICSMLEDDADKSLIEMVLFCLVPSVAPFLGAPGVARLWGKVL
ncbi:uncharacterized protein LOC125715261 isoform X2 [Brienomyrus brachyistius]|nr:uncharacterized protein LOC125715261 isoform X2 [Brienomyrus brachyistius]